MTFGDVTKYDAQMNLDEEESMLRKYREERQHGMFPDEVDTPQDTPARLRFQKYDCSPPISRSALQLSTLSSQRRVSQFSDTFQRHRRASSRSRFGIAHFSASFRVARSTPQP